ncbi:bifunctional DedA family/phosphatase PAP2 family protein [Spartinivicinus poritis]|uniref:Bifunctional DedA family/phosphatase PAP2 family protein n=1 Tax=Spartinivicinus poritis TaxID=2994640 RepID=A0ABT5U6D4_9GAMM|nr:bifunctional DedA family/phosphatase PAP2 family protein [Spartinivicinus sp. A2-2]MDE1461867.1 bifunctional DedA family/phosphatase PAP2 family protein [Spartinivicinus sp. A2-2]
MDLSAVQPLLDWLSANQQWLAIAILLFAFFESLAIVGIIIPGVALLYGVAALAGNLEMSIWLVLGCGFIGAVLGDGISFLVGHHYHEQIKQRWPFNRYPTFIERGESFFNKHGGKSIAIGRFVGPIRPVIPLVAGILNMPVGRFLLINICSAVAWAPVYLLPGYVSGLLLQASFELPRSFYLGLTIITLGIGVICWLVSQTTHQLTANQRGYQWFAQHFVNKPWWQRFCSPRQQINHSFPLADLLASIVCAILFITLFITITQNWWDDINQGLLSYFINLHQPLIDNAVIGITLLGDTQNILLLTVFAVCWLWFSQYRATAIYVGGCMITAQLITWGLKVSLAWPRPDVLMQLPSPYSFPSGHTTLLSTLALTISCLVATEQPIKKRWWIYFLGILPGCLVGFSRVYLGSHWFTDILAGLILSIIITALARFFYTPHDKTSLHTNFALFVLLAGVLLISSAYVVFTFPEAQQLYLLK